MPSCPRPSSSATAMGRRASLPAWVRHASAWLLLAALALPAAARDAQVAPPPATLETVQVRAERARDPLGDDRSSYAPEAVTLGKLPLSLREIPQSVSVLTRQQMDDQNLASFDQAMQQVAGVKVQAFGDGAAGYTARGYGLQVQYDGVPASQSLSRVPQYDLALYERIEVLRGPNGVLQGAGSPGGTTNLVRKRADLREPAARVALRLGSWDRRESELDIGGPLVRSGRLRARAVAADAHRGYWYPVAGETRGLGYLAVEGELAPGTVLGGAYLRQRNQGTRFMGLPTYRDGRQRGLPRDTYVGADWNRAGSLQREQVLELRHDWASGWQARASVRRKDIDSDLRYVYLTAMADDSLRGSGRAQQSRYRDAFEGADVYLSGPVQAFGRCHLLLLGLNSDRYRYRGGGAGTAFDDANILRPRIAPSALPAITADRAELTRQWGLYGSARISVTQALTVVLGGRLSQYAYRDRADPAAAWRLRQKERGVFTPSAGWVLDLDARTSLYASYADSFSPQSVYGADGRLPPRLGWQVESGLKREFLQGRLSAGLAVYRIREQHRALLDSASAPVCGPLGEDDCYRAAGLVQSQGWEAEVQGRLAEGWDISASYSRNDNVYLRDADAAMLHQPYANNAPRHLGKLWMRYRFGAFDGRLVGWSVGGGVQAQSGSFGNDRRITQGGYGLASLQVAKAFGEHLEASLTVDNLFDRGYYQRLGNTAYYNYYGPPRSWLLSLRGRF